MQRAQTDITPLSLQEASQQSKGLRTDLLDEWKMF